MDTPLRVSPEDDDPHRLVQRRCPDLPEPLQPPLHPGTKEPVGPDDLAPLFPMALIEQEMTGATRGSTSPARCSTSCGCGGRRRWCAAERLERALGTPARIYYKDESVSPAGSHKPNTAVPQAFYNQADGHHPAHHRDRRRPVGHRRSSFACAQFGLECKVYMVRGLVRAEAVPPGDDGDVGRVGRAVAGRRPDHPGSLGAAISDAVRDAAGARRHALLARVGAQPRAAAPDHHRARGQGAARAGRRDPTRRRDRLVRRRIEPRRHRAAVRARRRTCASLAVEPSSCPTLTEGTFDYDFGDTAGMTPLLPMYTLGHDFVPPSIHAGGLRYHGDSPIISQLVKTRPDGGRRLPAGQDVRGRGAVRPHRGQDPRARDRPRHPGRDRRGARGQGGRRGARDPVQLLRSRLPRPAAYDDYLHGRLIDA